MFLEQVREQKNYGEKSIEVMYDKDEDMFSLFVNGKKAKFSFNINLPKGDIVIGFEVLRKAAKKII